MKAVCWHGKNDVRVDTVPDPGIVNPRDAVVKITSTAICGSDLHLYDGCIPTMQKGDILGHEFMGEVVEVGPANHKLKKGDRVVVPFTISCGHCFYCNLELWSLCDNSNPNAWMAEGMYGYSGAGIFGYSHLYGGYAGGQAEYARVPLADSGPIQVPDGGIPDEKLLFLSDVFPTGYMAAEHCNIHQGDIIAVWGCGPVGQFAVRSAFMLGADRVIAIDRLPVRLDMARAGGAEVLNYEEVDDIVEALKQMTGGRGPDACIEAVGMESHGTGISQLYDTAMQTVRMETDRPYALREALQACRKGGTVSIPGVFSGFIDKIPMGAAFAKGLTLRMGQTHVQKYMLPLLDRVMNGEIDPSFIVTHRRKLEEAPEAYREFKQKEDNCVKLVLKT